MLHPKPRLLLRISKIITPALVLFLIASCKSSDTRYFLPTVVKKYPKNRPFVYKTNIKLTDHLSKTERANLESRLRVQLEDSVNPRASEKILWQVIKRPPVFDTSYVQSSRKFMLAMLHSSGYFRSEITYDTIVKRDEDKHKLILNFNVSTGPLWHLDSIWYNIHQPELQRLADSTLRADTTKKQVTDSITLGVGQPFQQLADSTVSESYLRKGSSFSQDTIALELDRLVELYRNNGYMRFTRKELVGVWDTVDVSVLRPLVNPLEQIELIKQLTSELQNPTATLEIKLRPGYDSSKLIKYYIGKIYIYPDFGPDSLTEKTTVVLDTSYTVIYNHRLFKPKILPQSIYMRHGQAYRQQSYINTINRFNSNVAWRLVTIDPKPRPGTDTVDLFVKLVPSKKYLFVLNLEGSRNENSFSVDNNNAFAQGNLLGIAINLSLQNRNFARAAAQTNTTLRYGTEFSVGTGQKFVSSRQASFGYNIVFPKIIPHFDFLPERFREAKTILAFNLSNTQRIDFYNITSFNTYWSYELQRRNKIYAIKIPNIEYSLLNAKRLLDSLFKLHPGIRNLFNDGLIVSLIGSFTVNGITKKHINTLRANVEESGLITGLLQSNFIKKNLYRFVKADVELKRLMKINNTDLVGRLFAGVGFPITVFNGSQKRSLSLPFFKAYTAGGPNSMRAWGLRRLGPGHSSIYYDTIPDRFGDIQLEANLEYRFHAFNLFGFSFNSALFTDVGNVWFLRKNPDFPGGEFTGDFIKDLAVDVGTGIRVDLGFFMIRLDYAFKVRNPNPEPVNLESQYKWFYGWQWKTVYRGVLQFGVTYPF